MRAAQTIIIIERMIDNHRKNILVFGLRAIPPANPLEAANGAKHGRHTIMFIY